MKKTVAMSLLTLFVFACANSTQQDLETARFKLDQGKFDEAIALVDPILDAEPNNNEAKFILGSALVGNFALNPKPGCKPTDIGYLGLLACLLDEKPASDPTGLTTFNRIAPTNSSLNNDINRAVDVLVSIKSFDDKTPEKDVALQRLVARAFAISTLYQIIGANTPNVSCNSGTSGQVDEVPDGYDPGNVTPELAVTFENNLIGIEQDARISGLEADFKISTQATAILDSLEAVGLSTQDSVITIFNEAYDTTAQQVCS